MKNCEPLASALLVCCLAWSGASSAAEPTARPERLGLCVNRDATISDREALDVCSSIIDDRGAAAEDRTIALLARGGFRLGLFRDDVGALADYEAGVETAPTDHWRARAHFGRAQAFYVRGDMDRAVVAASVAASYDPEGYSLLLR